MRPADTAPTMEQHAAGLESAFYKGVLALVGPDELRHSLERGLALLARVTAASIAYLEVIDARDAIHLGYAAEGARDIDAIRARVSPEILRACLSRGVTVVTPCALEDECFRDLESVRQHQPEGILCVPIAPLVGAIYLQGARAFSQLDREHAELLASHAADRLLRRDRRSDRLAFHRATQWFQRRHVLAALERSGWNIAEAARELEVARSYLYKLIASLRLRRAED